MNKLRFYAFHLMPYPDIPPTAEFDSSWVSLSNKYYNPHRGRVLYNEYIDQLASAEDFGFDGVGVNEHHANYYGTMPSPNIIAAMLIQRTNRIPIGVIGNAIPLHGNPLRVAEEIAMLDVISGGRIISGFVRGIGCEYFNNPVPPGDSQERFAEAHDLIIKAWTDEGPFTWQGDHFAGAMDKGACAFQAPGTTDDIYSWSQMRLTPTSFEYLDGWFNPDGSVYRVLADDWYVFEKR